MLQDSIGEKKKRRNNKNRRVLHKETVTNPIITGPFEPYAGIRVESDVQGVFFFEEEQTDSAGHTFRAIPTVGTADGRNQGFGNLASFDAGWHKKIPQPKLTDTKDVLAKVQRKVYDAGKPIPLDKLASAKSGWVAFHDNSKRALYAGTTLFGVQMWLSRYEPDRTVSSVDPERSSVRICTMKEYLQMRDNLHRPRRGGRDNQIVEVFHEASDTVIHTATFGWVRDHYLPTHPTIRRETGYRIRFVETTES